MKTSIATTLSIAGVIAAGAAAYAVNTSVLGASADPTPAAVASTTTSAATNVSQPNGQSVAAAAVTAEENVVNDSTTTYKVGDAGSVVIDTSSGRIVVANILPSAGYTSEPARTDANGVVKVHFVSSTQRIEFIARMVNGAVVTDVVNEARPPQRGDHDDDDDNDHDDDEHEEREHHDDDHDDDRHEDEDDD
jgi:hypothetical protein